MAAKTPKAKTTDFHVPGPRYGHSKITTFAEELLTEATAEQAARNNPPNPAVTRRKK
jgi:hypothetical protein